LPSNLAGAAARSAGSSGGRWRASAEQLDRWRQGQALGPLRESFVEGGECCGTRTARHVQGIAKVQPGVEALQCCEDGVTVVDRDVFDAGKRAQRARCRGAAARRSRA